MIIDYKEPAKNNLIAIKVESHLGEESLNNFNSLKKEFYSDYNNNNNNDDNNDNDDDEDDEDDDDNDNDDGVNRVYENNIEELIYFQYLVQKIKSFLKLNYLPLPVFTEKVLNKPGANVVVLIILFNSL